MITVNSVLENVAQNEKLREEYKTLCQRGQGEKITISRLESRRVRMRKTTDKGTDIGLILEPGTVLRNGDVLYHTKDKMIVIELEPENVAILTFKPETAMDDELFEIAVKVGHAIGNLHRPIKVDGNNIIVPIQADSEIELLNRVLALVLEHLTISNAKMVFEPDEGTHIHEHQ